MAVLHKETMLTLGSDGLLHSWTGTPPPPPPPPPPPSAPVARITTTLQDNLHLVLSASTSTPGTTGAALVGYTWDLGDNSGPVFGISADHTYAAAGTYFVSLTVTDSNGVTNSTRQGFTLTSVVAGDLPPVPSFTSTINRLTLTVDASGSTDPDGTVAGYTWTFGDGGATTGATASHVYAGAGTFPVTLTVTDDLGASSSLTRTIIINNAPPPVISGLKAPNTGMSVTLSGTITDPSGDMFTTVVDWGDNTSTANVTLPVSHTYATIGPWTIVVTATNSHGASDQASVSASPSAGTNTPYRNDDGLGTRNGQEPTAASAGVPLASYDTLAGAEVLARLKSAGSTVMSLGPGAFTVRGFDSGSNFNATNSVGMIGAGSAQTTLSQVPNSSVNAPVGSNLLRLNGTNGFLEDFSLVGTPQTVGQFNTWTGIMLNGDNWTLRRLRLVGAAPGNNSAPPGETFGISLYKSYGTVLIEDVEIDGQGVGASNFATNGSGTDATMPSTFLTVNRLYTHANRYSGGIAIWQTKFDARSVMNDCVFDGSRCFWNVERCSGTITLNRPRIGRLDVMPSGTWDTNVYGNPNGSPLPNGTVRKTPSAIGIFAESDNTWGATASKAFRFIVRDPRNLDGSPYSGPKLGITFGTAADGGTNYYGKANFKAYDAAGTDISSTFFTYGGGGFV